MHDIRPHCHVTLTYTGGPVAICIVDTEAEHKQTPTYLCDTHTHSLTHSHTGPVAMCNAATEGDVRYLKLLIRCGVNPDVGDYDNR